MILLRFFPAVALFVALFATLANAQTLSLDFDEEMTRTTGTSKPSTDRWKFYVTREGDVLKDLRDEEEVMRYITPIVSEKAKWCRFQSRENYVGLGRLVDPEFAEAKRITWEWSVKKHPRKGKIGGTPNDAAMNLYIVFRVPIDDFDESKKNGINEFTYTGLCFCWTADSKIKQKLTTGRNPFPNSPTIELMSEWLQNGDVEGTLSEEIDIQTKYRDAFSKKAPPIWGIGLLADSNDVKAAFNKETMTTHAEIGNIQLHKK